MDVVFNADAGAVPVATFSVELARTSDELRQGLRHREYLAPDRGMLFDLGRTRIAHFTMSDTLIPLDMIFISRHGEIVQIIENTIPLEKGPFVSKIPVRAVLEINGGLSAQLGIRVGNYVLHPVFSGRDKAE